MFLSQLEAFVIGMRNRDSGKALHDAEVHSAFLWLIEDEHFAALFRKHLAGYDREVSTTTATPNCFFVCVSMRQ